MIDESEIRTNGTNARKGLAGLMRIASLLPSLTEICFALGLGNQLVAVTHECDFPGKAREIPSITRSILPPGLTESAEINRRVSAALADGSSLYELDRDRLAARRPDLILTQELCHVCAVSLDEVRAIAATLDPVPQVASIEPTTLPQVIQSIATVGSLTERTVTANAMVDALQRRIDRIRDQVGRTEHRHRVVCLEWLDPPMVAGHWVPEMVEIAGGTDPLGQAGKPSFGVTWQDVIAAAPDTIVLMPCGYGLADTVTEANRLAGSGKCISTDVDQIPAVRDGHVYAVDGSAFFSRPGPRLVSGIEILAGILHAELAASHTPPGSVEPVHLLHAGVRG